jgi:hypothetical protein
MVSAHMQGGCLCENGPGLRVGTDNVEIASLMAPRPMLLVACTGDWTSKNPTEEWPAVKKIYDLYGAGDKTAVVQFNYQHNYNVESREAMYAWFGKWLKNDPKSENYKEKPFTADLKAMHAWTSKDPMPASALREPALTAAMADEGRAQLEEAWPANGESFRRFRAVYAPALEHSLFVSYPGKYSRPGGNPRERALLVVGTPADKQAIDAILNRARGQYRTVKGFTLPKVQTSESELWKNYFSTYNRTPLGDRVEAVLLEMEYLEGNAAPTVDVVGLGEAGPWALYARALMPKAMPGSKTAIDLGGLDLTSDSAMTGALYAPGIRRAGDLSTAAMLTAPSVLSLFNVGAGLPEKRLEESFESLGGSVRIDRVQKEPADIAEWLVAK